MQARPTAPRIITWMWQDTHTIMGGRWAHIQTREASVLLPSMSSLWLTTSWNRENSRLGSRHSAPLRNQTWVGPHRKAMRACLSGNEILISPLKAQSSSTEVPSATQDTRREPTLNSFTSTWRSKMMALMSAKACLISRLISRVSKELTV